MAETSGGTFAFADIFTTIRAALESEEGKVEAQAERLKKQIERDRDTTLLRLRKASAILDPAHEEPGQGASPRRKRKGPGKSKEDPSAKARRARESIYRHMAEKGEQVSSAELRDRLGLSASVVRYALERMLREGLVERIGLRADTRYMVRGGGADSRAVRKEETGGGLILTALEDRGWASPTELAQLLREPVERVEEEAGALIAEAEIEWRRRDGQMVYALVKAH